MRLPNTTIFYFKPLISRVTNNTPETYFTTVKYYEFTNINLDTVVIHGDLVLYCYEVKRVDTTDNLDIQSNYINVSDLTILGCMKWIRNKNKK